MMGDKKDVIAFRVTKENAAYLKKQTNQQEYLNEVIEGIRNGDIVSKATNESTKELELEYKKLRNTNLVKRNTKLDVETRIKLIHDLHIAPSVAVEVSGGRLSLDQVLSPQVATEKKYLEWVGQKLICDGCGHEHFSSGSRPCYHTGCDCQIKEVQLA